jgi:RNA polymerase sigma-70 factor (ECF subfamily)
MSTRTCLNNKTLDEIAVTERFLTAPDEESFTSLFRTFTPQLLSFFRARGCESSVAEDLAQDVMLAVHCNVSQVRDRNLFRAWLFKIARNAMCRYYSKLTQYAADVNLDWVIDRLPVVVDSAGTPAFEFRQWMNLLEPPEREVMTLRFVEQLEYHEIAAAQAIPIGTVQSRVFNAKRKLAPYLATIQPAPCNSYESRQCPCSDVAGMACFLSLLPEHPLLNVRRAMK